VRCCDSEARRDILDSGYHFLALGAELRDLGVTQPLGFFLHTPWPARTIIEECLTIANWSRRCWPTI